MTDDVAIKVDSVSKTFRLPHEKQSSLKGLFLSSFKRKGYENQEALKNVSLKVKKGEFFGIVGRNGSGKSTLLKCIAGVYIPNKGEIKVNGSLVPFIELGVGFNPELSGRDNVFLNGSLLGFSRKQMEAKYSEIVEFAELEEFMDQKLNNYSSGMQVRLAFSIAIRAKGDILLLDEVLAVGDTAFQKKCNDYFYQLKDQGQTVILVTHNMSVVEQYCDRAMIIDEGKVQKIGSPAEVTDLYNELNLRTSTVKLEKANKATETKETSRIAVQSKKSRKATITKVETFNTITGKKQDTFTNHENIGVRYHISVSKKIKSPNVGLVFKDKRSNLIFATNTLTQNVNIQDLRPKQKIKVEFEIDNLFTNSNYLISGAIAHISGTEVYHKVEQTHEFEIGGWKMGNGLAHPNHKINIRY
ncbi:MAG TPA: ABC transporter ATP-binding protein [Candidatus Saccharimonadales bacterium]|nr:ABC transporter ATP-binding protein [Candidatus Saccharimonadales bacterium]